MDRSLIVLKIQMLKNGPRFDATLINADELQTMGTMLNTSTKEGMGAMTLMYSDALAFVALRET